MHYIIKRDDIDVDSWDSYRGLYTGTVKSVRRGVRTDESKRFRYIYFAHLDVSISMMQIV